MDNIMQSLRRRFFLRSLKEGLKSRLSPRGGNVINLGEARSIGILFDATNLQNRNLVLNYAEQLRDQRKQVKLLGFFDSKLKDQSFTFRHFNRKDIDWALRPRGTNVEEFINQAFDILLHLDTSSSTYAEYISALSKASFKVGPITEQMICYDLMIDADQRTSLQNFIDQLEGLLEKTNA